ncbi:MAG: 50S ribosomal protein L23 [Microgenomates group bacterium GW2011_GWC1_37_8]|uniref:Large ribosomal subunit protein uL23 n=2 Tax=Candidatus Woeseibacteriota TaxID=1752722 RepID=A0A0G0NJC3_9BACT|nr:MAG: 50S ribosomal protein L23 [Microgenomates group bacterium GW2011_GWC1_37_8]KKQ86019.1 MAG: 50S ribosomal protein L23 [Candidatus Woesebacteria bacterium GW2011_GWB1_38_8]OGM21239.1 MAG: 50S ribosomal protein L23 [Candidatus Woesebacteria bacterium RIFCSPHIGHO2_01_FULL_38_9b]
MKLEPIITEKTLKLAQAGKYTFRVDKNLTKYQIKKLVNDIFNVHTQRIWTIKVAGEVKKTTRGEKRIIKPTKKAIVSLKEKEKIDLFETKKK